MEIWHAVPVVSEVSMITRPNTQQSSHGWFGRSGNVKTARNSEKFVTYLPTDTARCRVACPRLKISRLMNFCHSRAVHIGGFERIKKWKKVKDSEPGIQQHISQLNYFTAASNSPVHSISLVSTQNRQKQKPRVVATVRPLHHRSSLPTNNSRSFNNSNLGNYSSEAFKLDRQLQQTPF